jgi:hypothetical protein
MDPAYTPELEKEMLKNPSWQIIEDRSGPSDGCMLRRGTQC